MKQSPLITNLEWGEIETEAGTFRDVKLWPGGGRNWDWNETGTDHRPGIQVADVTELVKNGSEIIILGVGQNKQLHVKDETEEYFTDNDIAFEKLNSSEAVVKYNELTQEGKKVGALIHSTC